MRGRAGGDAEGDEAASGGDAEDGGAGGHDAEDSVVLDEEGPDHEEEGEEAEVEEEEEEEGEEEEEADEEAAAEVEGEGEEQEEEEHEAPLAASPTPGAGQEDAGPGPAAAAEDAAAAAERAVVEAAAAAEEAARRQQVGGWGGAPAAGAACGREPVLVAYRWACMGWRHAGRRRAPTALAAAVLLGCRWLAGRRRCTGCRRWRRWMWQPSGATCRWAGQLSPPPCTHAEAATAECCNQRGSVSHGPDMRLSPACRLWQSA